MTAEINVLSVPWKLDNNDLNELNSLGSTYWEECQSGEKSLIRLPMYNAFRSEDIRA